MSTAPPESRNRSFSTRQIAGAGIIAAIAASVANVIVYLFARAVDTIPDDLPSGAEQISIPAVIFTCVLTIAVATVAFWMFNRYSKDPVRNFVILSVIVFATSLTGPFSIGDASAGLVMSLLIMHVVATVVVLIVFTRLENR